MKTLFLRCVDLALHILAQNGLAVTALNDLFWFGIQRMAAYVQRLRKAGMRIVTSETDVSDILTETTRRVPVYQGDNRER